MAAFAITYAVCAVVFGFTFGRQYHGYARRLGMRHAYLAVIVSSVCWPINVTLTMIYGFRNDQP